MSALTALVGHLAEATGFDLAHHRLSAVGGGDINSSYKLQAEGICWFLKLNDAHLAEMFSAEAAGLQELAATGTIRVPKTILTGQYRQHAYLLLEYIELAPLRGPVQRLCGQQLAQLHRQPQPWFGWHRDNTIGSTPQHNRCHEHWAEFWRRERLGRQLQFAAGHGYGGTLQTLGERLMAKIDGFFSDYRPQPALLHGDLWGGNASADCQGQPVIYDPACYYGDREADLAMTELFGGFDRDFYAAYQAEYPIDAGYKTRKTLYNLYHILNHLNLFGSGYLRQATNMAEHLLAELG